MERARTATEVRSAVALARSRADVPPNQWRMSAAGGLSLARAGVRPAAGPVTHAGNRAGRRAQAPGFARGQPAPRTHTRTGDAVNARVALVPTMGFLHKGHLALIDRAREAADYVIVSVFVNPLQFGPGEDLERYPRDPERDAALAAEHGADLLFAPSLEELYPQGRPAIEVVPGRMGDRLCGEFRPGHFQGVLTVVLKLFNIVGPDLALFGQKDYQQAILVRRMVADLDVPVQIDVAPTEREADGLARSSRNLYLDAAERQSATALYRGLLAAETAFRTGERDGAALGAALRAVLDGEAGVRLQYVELVHPDTLEPVTEAEPGSVLAVAAFVGETRLIDNMILQ